MHEVLALRPGTTICAAGNLQRSRLLRLRVHRNRGGFFFRGDDVRWVHGQQVTVLISPSRGFAVERTLRVIGLVCHHLSNADDQVAQGLGRRPVVADADRAGVNIRVKDRRKHLAVRRAVRVRAR
jgi:hypothetical protein